LYRGFTRASSRRREVSSAVIVNGIENNETAGVFSDASPVAAGGGVMSRKVSSSLVVAVTIKKAREPRMDASAAAAIFFIF
jgi:hypothetical protein